MVFHPIQTTRAHQMGMSHSHCGESHSIGPIASDAGARGGVNDSKMSATPVMGQVGLLTPVATLLPESRT